MNWRAGDFDRQLVAGVLRPFCPMSAVNGLPDIDLERLWEQGKRLILLDVDNTLVQWHGEEFSAPVRAWLDQARSLGFRLGIISNTNRVDRLQRLSEALDVPAMQGRFKPSRQMFRQALEQFGASPSEAVMVGDQLLTDVFGANRTGIEAIWVRKMAGPEFPGTKINRLMERLLRARLYKALVDAEAQLEPDPAQAARLPLTQRPVFRQFLRFCVVGGSSFIIDSGLTFLLVRKVTVDDGQLLSYHLGTWLQETVPAVFRFANSPSDAAVPLLTAVAAGFAILNSFIWNRRWSFEIRGKEERLRQLRRFYAISIMGMGLNVAITSLLNNVIPGHPNQSLLLAKVVAAGVVAVWNFSGYKLYAFRRKASG